MNIGIFSVFTFLGAFIWNSILAVLGWQLSLHVGENELYAAVEQYNRYLTWGGYGIALICVAYILWHFFRNKNKK
jgi:membrane protein DedA with SNARE-associated domain